MKRQAKTDRLAASCLAGGGEAGALMRGTDWSRTPLGPVDRWSQSLRMMVSFLLANRFPLLLWWGPEFCQLYNDPYRPVLGTKHPTSMGQPASRCWSEIWRVIGPLIETPFTGGPATWMEDIPLEVNRHGFLEETHFTIAYSPVPDETAPCGIGGVLATVHEITEKVIAERRVVALHDLGTRAAEAKTKEDACAIAAATLANHGKDVPFALLYLIDPDGKRARLAGAAGVAPNRHASPAVVEFGDGMPQDRGWPLAEAVRAEAMIAVEDLPSRFARVPAGPWSDPPRTAVIVPIRSTKAHQLAGLLVAGVSPRLRLDHLYRSFFELVAAQIATTVAHARAYEEERKRAEALAEIDRAKTAFFSNVSHEFRTPLTLMLGPLEDALAAPAATLPQRRDDLALVHRNGLRLLRLVNTLLDFSRIEAGRVQASYEPVDLAASTAELASVFRAATDKAGLSLAIDCPPLEEPVWVDRDMWEKIVLNLVSNAFKFTFAGSIAVRLRQEGGNAVLAVADTGTGIPADELPQLFDRFHRVEGARGRTHEGTGIGLALVQELVRLHGGTVRVESAPGEGSTFTAAIPLGTAHLPRDRLRAERTLASTGLGARPFVAEALRWLPGGAPGIPPETVERELLPDQPAAAAEGEHATVLLADDNADMRDYLRRLLAPRYEVRTVGDGIAALDALRAHRADLVLSDVMMPRLDGFGLVRQIRADPALAQLPVVLLSARAGEEASIEGLEAGADDYLVKPFSARELLARVGANLETARIRREAQQRMLAQKRILEMVATGAPMSDTLDELMLFIEHQEPGICCGLLVAAEDGLHFGRGSGPNLPKRYHEALNGAPMMAPYLGPCSEAAHRRTAIAVPDIVSETRYAREWRELMLSCGFRAVRSTPVCSSDGGVLGSLEIYYDHPRDPTPANSRLIETGTYLAAIALERKKTEQALRASQDQLQAIFNASPIGVYLVDSDFRIRQVNPSARPAFGDIPDLIGRDFDKVIHRIWPQAFADEVVAIFRRTLATGEPYHDPERIEQRRDRDATEYYEWRINRVVLPEGRYGVVCYFRDISAQVLARRTVAASEKQLRELNDWLERKVAERSRELEAEMTERQKVEAVLHQAQRLEAIGQLTGGVAHDFNNLLTVVMAQAETIARSADGNERIAEMADATRRAAERGAQLTSQLLSFSGRQQLRPMTVAVSQLIRDIGDLVRRTIGETITVELSVEPRLWQSYLDPTQFESAILNLAINARDAMPGGGRLVIASRNAVVTGSEARRLDLAPGDYVVTSVADTGIGMAAEVQRRAFEPFFTTKDVGKGTGLGLSQVYGFARQSGGTTIVESAASEGTTVTLYLPRARAPVAKRPPGPAPRPTRRCKRGRTILLVEDQPEVREVMEISLGDLGYRIVSVPDGVAARKVLESDKTIDLLLSDVVMPNGVSGFDLAEDARRLRGHLKIVLVSGYLREPQDRARSLPGLIFLEKPFRVSELAHTVAAALAGKRHPPI